MFNIKILSGPMYGSEIDLPKEKIFFVVAEQNLPGVFNQEKLIGESVGSAMENTLIIPSAQASPNFLLDLTRLSKIEEDLQENNEDENKENTEQVQATLYTETGLQELNLPLQKIVFLGNLRLAIKKNTEIWSETVTGFLNSGTLLNTSGQPEITPSDSHAIKDSIPKNNCFFKIGFGLVALIGVLIAAFYFIHTSYSSKNISEKKLVGEGIQSLAGTDGFTYFLIDGQNLAAWKRMLSRQKAINEKTKLRTIRRESDFASQSLDNANLLFWKVSLQNPVKPEVLTSNQITNETEQKISFVIRNALPYAKEVVIKKIAADVIIQQAISMLETSGMPYTVQHSSSAVAINIRGTFDDQQLNTANQLINRFYQQWGNRFITFKLELVDQLSTGGTKKGINGTIEYKQQHIYFG